MTCHTSVRRRANWPLSMPMCVDVVRCLAKHDVFETFEGVGDVLKPWAIEVLCAFYAKGSPKSKKLADS